MERPEKQEMSCTVRDEIYFMHYKSSMSGAIFVNKKLSYPCQYMLMAWTDFDLLIRLEVCV